MSDGDTSVIVAVCRAPAVDFGGREKSADESGDVRLTPSLPLQAHAVKTEQGKLHSVLLSVSARRRRRGGDTDRPRGGSRSPLPPPEIQEPEKDERSETKPLCSNLLHSRNYDGVTTSVDEGLIPRAVSAGSLTSSISSGDTAALVLSAAGDDQTTATHGHLCGERRRKKLSGKLRRIRKRTGKERI